MTRPIYLDHHATTPVDRRVADVVVHTMTSAFGNPNSVEHVYGEESAALVVEARRQIAALVSADPDGVHFTCGSSEAIRVAVDHAAASVGTRPIRIALSQVEHRAMIDAVTARADRGEASLRWLPVDGRACLDLSALEAACREGVDLVCVMAANNEVGTIFPVEEVARVAGKAGARILVDATQAAGRIPLACADWGITYLTISAHKIYGPKGIGALVATADLDIRPAHGSTSGTGDGTPNVPGIVGLGKACELRRLEMGVDEPRMAAQRDRLEALLLAAVDLLVVNGDRHHRLANNLHISVPGVPNDAVVIRLRNQVALSTGAACSSGAQTPSHVLRAMNLPESLQEGALRLGTGKFTTDEEIERAGQSIAAVIAATRSAIAGTR